MNYRKLRGKIIEKFGTIGKFCERIGRTKVSVSNKLNGKTGFSQREILAWCDILDIDHKDIGDFFYDISLTELNNEH